MMTEPSTASAAAPATPAMNGTSSTGLPALPNFFDPATLRAHIAHTMAFYHPRAIDPSGGFYHFFLDDGSVYDRTTRHLVSSTRFIFVYARAWREFADPAFQDALHHGLAFLRGAHRQADGAYWWQLQWQDGRASAIDADNHCYGLAFVMLAYASALQAGVPEARAWITETFALMEAQFWQAEHGLYLDQISSDWQQRDPYRGQNANMHACEALLAAWHASGEIHYLQRAETLAHNITVRQANRAGGMIWEHYDANWSPDWDYNRDDPANLFRPWGYQPGHFTEWAKLLLQLERQQAHLRHDGQWLLPRAEALFTQALQHGWDPHHGGIAYGFAPDFSVCDGDKYFWVQAESLAAAAMLAARTGKGVYRDWYQRLWAYCWQHLIDHRHGAWYRILSNDNQKLSAQKSPAGKTDYHTMGACYDAIDALQAGFSGTNEPSGEK
jgi:mannose/cellobiose epimerase-like protein (N-acyl-D-glucosamine 2-epimerase family)